MYKLKNQIYAGTVTQVVTRTLDDGSYMTIPFAVDNSDYAQFKKAVLDGAELQDAEGNTMSAEQATQFVKELP
jgi:hypothetical protein